FTKMRKGCRLRWMNDLPARYKGGNFTSQFKFIVVKLDSDSGCGDDQTFIILNNQEIETKTQENSVKVTGSLPSSSSSTSPVSLTSSSSCTFERRDADLDFSWLNLTSYLDVDGISNVKRSTYEIFSVDKCDLFELKDDESFLKVDEKIDVSFPLSSSSTPSLSSTIMESGASPSCIYELGDLMPILEVESASNIKYLALLLLTSLPASYEQFVDTLLYRREALTLKDVMATLNSKKIKEISKAKGDDGEGLYVRGRTDRRDSRQLRGKSRSKSRGGRLKCYICQSEDHLKRNCLKNNHKKSTGYVKKDEQPSFSGSTYDDSEVMMVMSAQAHALLDWIIDSGCSYHMTPRLDILFDFLKCDGGSVQLGDNMECKIRGIGKVRVQLKDESSFMLHNVMYIPELKRNLISLGTLEKEGFTVKLQSGKVKVTNGSRVVLSGIRRDNCVYSLDGHAMAGELNAIVEEKDTLAQVWHKRLGHISEARLHVLEKQGLFGKKSLGKLDFYENCVLGKSHRVSFGVGRHTTQGVIDYVHSDLWGPSQVESLGGKRYFLSIADDYSRRVWVYILKFEAFGKFKEWKQLVENQTGRTVKKLRTDNGLEFCNREFEQLCIENGIARHLTITGTPQQNGIAERMNRTLMDKVRSIEKKTPLEIWSGHLSDYEMYLEGVKGYRLYRLDDESPKIVTSKNVVFNKNVMYKDTLKDSGAGNKSVEELQVGVELQRLNNHTPEEDQTDPEDGDDEDAGDQATDQPPDLIDYQLVRDNEPRTRTKPLRFRDESNMAAYAFVPGEEEDTHEPLTYQEAVACEDSSKWKAAMKEEMDSLRKNKTWELVDHPARQKLVRCKWLFKIKEGIEGVQNPRYKARLVARGFTQRACIDYNELKQLDVKTTFLHWNLEKVIYIRHASGYEQGVMHQEFDMKELGEAKKILGMEIVKDRSRKILRVSQSGYISKILNNFRIDNGKSVQMPLGGHFKLSLKDCPVRDCDVERMSKVPYANAVGRLMYLMVCTRPYIAYAVSVVSRYLVNPGKNHWEAVKWILKYLWGTTNVDLVYGTNRGNHVDVTGFVDSDYAKDSDEGRSITGYAFFVQGCVVSWNATLQHVVALSNTEAEYMALTEAVKEAIWLRGLLEELGVELNIVAINCDNQGAIHLSQNHVFHERTKHINVHYHFIREVLETKTVKVLKVGTEHNAADALTKVVHGLKLQHCLELLNVGVG
ncbi:retrovirus-related pol polyprotein from transposon TNT 1-94, partial [Tanacetum coccineum]